MLQDKDLYLWITGLEENCCRDVGGLLSTVLQPRTVKAHSPNTHTLKGRLVNLLSFHWCVNPCYGANTTTMRKAEIW